MIPIINENDTVVVQEIKFGDNDNLSALVTNLVNADLLIILSDIDGLYDRDPRLHKNARLIPRVDHVTPEMEKKATGTLSPIGIGGMVTKLQAARKAALFGVPTILANGLKEGILERVLKGAEEGTLFTSEINKLTSRKHWIAFTLEPAGKIIVDEGAKKAILQKGKSLLPSGVIGTEGKFGVGDPVVLLDAGGNAFAKGLVNYGSSEISKIRGAERPRRSKAGWVINTTMRSSIATIWSVRPRPAEPIPRKEQTGGKPCRSDRKLPRSPKGPGNLPGPGESLDGRPRTRRLTRMADALLRAAAALEKGERPRCRRGAQGAASRRP